MNEDHIPLVYKAISDVTAHLMVEGISKDRRNETQKFNFRGIDQFMNAVAPALVQAGLVVIPRVIDRIREERETRNGGSMFYTSLTVAFDFVATADGSHTTCVTVGEAMDSADKSSNKAMSAALKYAYMQTFCVPTEGLDDADAHSPEPSRRMVVDPAPLIALKDKLKGQLEAAKDVATIDAIRASEDWKGAMGGTLPGNWREALSQLARERMAAVSGDGKAN